jgi:hypothetical protein
MQGIAKCRVFVLVFTDHANDSEHVGREVANAFSLGLAVIPFRVEAVNPGVNLDTSLRLCSGSMRLLHLCRSTSRR